MSENQAPEEVKEEIEVIEVIEEKMPVELVEMAPVEQPKTSDKGAIINALDIQSIEIPDKFTIVRQTSGWLTTLDADKATKITVNLKSMRRLEYTLRSGDTIEKDRDSIIILQTVPEGEEESTPRVSRSLSYRSRRRTAEGEETTTDRGGTNTTRSRRRETEEEQTPTE